MKPHLLCLGVAALLAKSASALSVSSEPVGYANLPLRGASDSHIAVPFTRPPDFVGAVQSVSGSTITVNGSPNFAPNKYVYAAGTQPNHYYVLIGSGGATNPKEGHTFLITGNSANTITVDTSLEPLTGITADTKVSVIPFWTLATLFPASDMDVSFTPTTATSHLKTQVLIANYSADGINLPPLASYYFSNNADGTQNNVGWRLVGDNTTDRGDDILLPDNLFIVRNQNGAPTLPLTSRGDVLTKRFATPLRTLTSGPQDNPAAVIRPADVSLNMTGLSPGDGSFVANDHLLVFDNAQIGFDKEPAAVYYRDAANSFIWRLTGETNVRDRGSDVVPLGTGFLVRKAPTAGGGNVFWTNEFPLQAISAVSRKVHGGAATYDINLPLTGRPGIECRSGGATGDHQVVVTFAESITVNGAPQAVITSGAASVGSGGVANGGAVTVSGDAVTIPLTSVTNAQTLTVTLKGVSNGSTGGDITIPLSFLGGDSNDNGTVNAGDSLQTRSRAGQSTTAANFRSDLNADGFINSGDTIFVRARSGTALP